MGRPLTGSARQVSPNCWEASVPEQRGSKKKVIRFFQSKAEADDWLSLACAAVKDGLVVPEPKVKEHWLDSVTDTWFDRVYGLEHRAQPGRARDVRRYLDNHVLPFFKPRWATPADVGLDSCLEFVHFLAGLRTADGRLVVEVPGYRPTAIRKSTQGNIIGTLKDVLEEAVLRRIVAFNPAASLQAVTPNANAKMRTRSSKASMCTLATAASIAGGMHLIHQLALWIQRIVGLRVSEVYGITVEDVIRDGDSGAGFVLINSQGGGNFEVWDVDGDVRTTRNLEQLKTLPSYRVAAVTRSLMKLIDLVIDLYHRDAEGNIDQTAPLVPGIARLDGGRDRYREALKEVSITEDSSYICPHDLRKSMVRDLTHKTGIPAEIRRLIVGHLAGGDVHDRIYNGQALDLAPMRGPRDEMEAIIESEIGTLLVPTTKSVCFWRGHPMRSRMEHAESVLAERGLLIVLAPGLTTDEVSARIGRSPQVIRRYIEQGVLSAREIRVNGAKRWVVDEDSVQRFIDRYSCYYTYQDLEAEAAMTTQQVRAAVKFLEIVPVHDETLRRELFTAEDVRRLVDHRAVIDRVKQRSVTLEAAADILRRRRSTLQNWVGRGLDLDPEASTVGLRGYVSRESVERMRLELAGSIKRSRDLPGRPTVAA